MTHEEIVRWVRRFRYDPEFRTSTGAATVPIRQFCDYAGINRSHFYRVMRGEDTLTENVATRVAAAIDAVQKGLRWKRVDSGKTPGYNNTWVMVNPEKFHGLPRYERLRRSA
jgi:hypothetical protein